MHASGFIKAGLTKTGFTKAAAGAALVLALAATTACSQTPVAGSAATGAARSTAKVAADSSLTLTSLTQNVASAAQKPTAPALKTYTFPDGHISFAFPANWQVRTELGPTIPGGPLDCYQAVLTDQRGKEMAFMVSGFYGDGAAGPVDRHVFDSAPVPGLADFGGEPSFGFVRDTVPGAGENLLMDIRPAAEFQDGSTSGGSGQLVLPNGVGIFRANVKASGLSSDGAVKAWMRSSDYAQLKAMLLSVSYR